MFNPFFDASKLTNKELYEKINSQSDKISVARAAGLSSDMLNSMFMVIQACDDELLFRQSSAEVDKLKDEDSCVFDTDKYLNSNAEENEKNDSKRQPRYKSGW